MNIAVILYTVKGKNFPVIWEFSYDTEGFLVEFKILEGQLNEKQINWLFHKNRFPYTEQGINSWSGIKNIEVIKGKPDLSFDKFYNTYNHKVKKVVAQRTWKRLSKVDRINAIAGIRPYDNHLKRNTNKPKAYPATYLNQRYWEDNYSSI